jgi:hypothetical protein
MILEVLTAAKMSMLGLYVDTNVLEEHTVSIFMAEGRVLVIGSFI